MRSAIVLAILAFALVAAPARAQLTSQVAGGPHDLSSGSSLRNSSTAIDGQTCIFCHAPHGGSNTIALWNRGTPSSTYQLYTSSTTTVTTTSASLAASGSGACLSCHDGTIAMDVLTSVNGVAFGPSVSFTRQSGAKGATFGSAGTGANNVMNSGLPFLGTDLRNDHPVNIVYATAASSRPGEYTATNVSGVKITVGSSSPLPLYGTSASTATVECASCHNAHDNHLGNFLRKANTGSAMCLTCHIK